MTRGERYDVVIIGGGQAGLATSHELRRHGVSHILLERQAVGHSWRSQRPDSFCLVTPNWTITLPGGTYDGADPDGFMPCRDWIGYLEAYAGSFDAPVATGVAVSRLTVEPGGEGFQLETSDGPIGAKRVVVATGTYQRPKPPPLAGKMPGRVHQLMADQYRNPGALPPGGVLVVGSGQTGCQIAEELLQCGRPTTLCVGSAGRLPRRYRGRDCIDWQNRFGWLDRTPDMLDNPVLRFRGDPHLTGRHGGRTISLHWFRAQGMRLLGRLLDIEGETLRLAPSLEADMRRADDFAAKFLAEVDAHIARTGLEAEPAEALETYGFNPDNGWSVEALDSLDLAECGIATVIWAVGFGFDFSWIDAPVLDAWGYPRGERGVSPVNGLYFMGLNWMYKRKSGIIYGVGEDAEHVAAHIAATR